MNRGCETERGLASLIKIGYTNDMSITDVLSPNMRLLPAEIRREVQDYVDFLLAKYRAEPAKPKAGCMKGSFVWMSDDFNAPLDDFRNYQ